MGMFGLMEVEIIFDYTKFLLIKMTLAVIFIGKFLHNR
jgi:hypothetical protein